MSCFVTGHEHATLPRGNLSDGHVILKRSNAMSKDTMQGTILDMLDLIRVYKNLVA